MEGLRLLAAQGSIEPFYLFDQNLMTLAVLDGWGHLARKCLADAPLSGREISFCFAIGYNNDPQQFVFQFQGLDYERAAVIRSQNGVKGLDLSAPTCIPWNKLTVTIYRFLDQRLFLQEKGRLCLGRFSVQGVVRGCQLHLVVLCLILEDDGALVGVQGQHYALGHIIEYRIQIQGVANGPAGLNEEP